MGKVLVAKNNDINNTIHQYAQMSFDNNELGYYNSNNKNEEYIKKIKEDFGEEGIIILMMWMMH